MIFLITPFSVIVLAMFGFLMRKQTILTYLILIEIVLLSIAIAISYVSYIQSSLFGTLYGIYIITTAAVESAIVICLVVQFFRFNGTVNISSINSIRINSINSH